MSNNQKFYKYLGLQALATKLVAGVTGPLGWIAGTFLAYLFNWLSMKGIYFVNVTGTRIETNMDKTTWEKVGNASWDLKDKIDMGLITLSEAELKEKSKIFRTAFRKFAVYGRVLDDGSRRP